MLIQRIGTNQVLGTFTTAKSLKKSHRQEKRSMYHQSCHTTHGDVILNVHTLLNTNQMQFELTWLKSIVDFEPMYKSPTQRIWEVKSETKRVQLFKIDVPFAPNTEYLFEYNLNDGLYVVESKPLTAQFQNSNLLAIIPENER